MIYSTNKYYKHIGQYSDINSNLPWNYKIHGLNLFTTKQRKIAHQSSKRFSMIKMFMSWKGYPSFIRNSQVYITYIYKHVCIYLYLYLFICYKKIDRKIFYILKFWSKCSMLVPLCPLFATPFQNLPYRHETCSSIGTLQILIRNKSPSFTKHVARDTCQRNIFRTLSKITSSSIEQPYL